eukprot:TRINITY_DN4707_c0_g1_i3.p1 TRINITY_DN4707_c0_g1~~TRINITY_DN4707_c0_g1_i3.p1  ORF type:complete len:213 (+),score=44.07 TRINITY_DN4707_c0_g1_i3:481-1119(+)
MNKKVVKSAGVLQSCSKRAGVEIEKWEDVEEECVRVLEGVMSYVKPCCGEEGVLEVGELGWGGLGDLPGCVEVTQAKTLQMIDELLLGLKTPLDEMKAIASLLEELFAEAQRAYLAVSTNPQLHVVYLTTCAPFTDYLSTLKAASTAFRLQYIINRNVCSFSTTLKDSSGTTRDKLEALSEALSISISTVKQRGAIDSDHLYLLQTTGVSEA